MNLSRAATFHSTLYASPIYESIKDSGPARPQSFKNKTLTSGFGHSIRCLLMLRPLSFLAAYAPPPQIISIFGYEGSIVRCKQLGMLRSGISNDNRMEIDRVRNSRCLWRFMIFKDGSVVLETLEGFFPTKLSFEGSSLE